MRHNDFAERAVDTRGESASQQLDWVRKQMARENPIALAQIEARQAYEVREVQTRSAATYKAYGLVEGVNTPQELAHAQWNKRPQPVLVRRKDGQTVALYVEAAVQAVMNGAELL